MENSLDILDKINVPTSELNADLLQEILTKAKASYKAENLNVDDWNKVSQILWQHIQLGFKKLEEQLLCATCFYTVLPLTDNHDNFLIQILDIIQSEISFRKKSNTRTNSHLTICLMYGIFQSSFFAYKLNDVSTITCILDSTFNLLISMCYEYSQHTFLAFKVIRSFNKICGNDLENIIFSEENNVKLLHLVIHNWENPITGVRDLLKDIFKTVVNVIDDTTHKTIIEEINGFNWNKAKYLMLSVIVEADVSYNSCLTKLKSDDDWIHGLMWSLHKPGLVSAGADLYFAILKKIFSEEEWCKIFLSDVVKILSGTSYKAIENFNNYWCLSTLKAFPCLMGTILSKLEMNDTEQKLSSILNIMKQGNKLGIFNKWYSNDEHKKINYNISIGLEHANPKIRMLAFEIVCNKHEKSLPRQTEYEFILDFLHNNLNSDCTVLRLSLLGSLKCFLSQLHLDFLNYMKNCTKIDEENFLHFCYKLQKILIDSLNVNGNYQRKIASIKSVHLVWTCFSKITKRKQNNTALIKYLTDKSLWILTNECLVQKIVSLLKDPSEDIRENVVQLLRNYYTNDVILLLDHLNEDALTSLKSKFFYEISCGRIILKLISKIIFEEKHNKITYKSIEDIFFIGYNQLITEYKKKDIMYSIENGKQLHSIIGILYVVVEEAILQKYRLNIPIINMELLLNALEDIANQFCWEQESSISSDFSKMNDMVQDIITKSGYDILNNYDETKISGLHQIILNCLWLNVKASCDLAALLIQYYSDDELISKKCLNIIAHVLETSRHKGAIEAAGAALGQAVQCLTSLPEDSIAFKLPHNLLVSKLKDLISEHGKMSSITRRGAGLSIMVHRIVSRDIKKGKSMFHYFMSTLLEACDVEETQIPQGNTSQENHDLPKAIYIHFLTRIVADSSLSSEVMFYSAKLAQLAFNNLISPHWQIRNAALQLYGALVPRQIGQKKVSGTDNETIATVACDELRTHSPELWIYIKEQLYTNSNYSDLKSHSNLVPILNLLGNSAMRYNFSWDLSKQKESDEELFKSLTHLLGSPIYIVRRLTAKSIFNIFPFEIIYQFLLHQEIILENMLHGCLMLLENCFMFYTSSSYHQYFSNLRIKFSNVIGVGHHSYVCYEKFEKIFSIKKSGINEIKWVFLKLDNYASSPGTYVWANNCVKNNILHSKWNEIPHILQLLLDRNDLENYSNDILLKIESDNSIPETELLKIVYVLLSYQNKFCDSLIWKILFYISLKIDLSYQANCVSILFSFKEKDVTYKQRYLIPFVARIFVKTETGDSCNLPEIIFNLTDPDKIDVDMRYIAALANNELANAIEKMSDTEKVFCIKTAVVLLQDEDEDVRSLNVNFYTNIIKSKIPIQPYICLQKILENLFLNSIFDEPQNTIPLLYNELSDILYQYADCTLDEYNPFAQNSKNIYFESEVLKQLIHNVKV